LKPKCEESLSSFAFNCNLRHYSVDLQQKSTNYLGYYTEHTEVRPDWRIILFTP